MLAFKFPPQTSSRKRKLDIWNLNIKGERSNAPLINSCQLGFLASKEFRLWYKQNCRTIQTLGKSATCGRWALWVAVGWNCKSLGPRDTKNTPTSEWRDNWGTVWHEKGVLIARGGEQAISPGRHPQFANLEIGDQSIFIPWKNKFYLKDSWKSGPDVFNSSLLLAQWKGKQLGKHCRLKAADALCSE